MKGILAIYRREMSSYFVSPIAYVVIGFFLFIAGFFFYDALSVLINQQLMMSMQAQRYGGPSEMDVPGLVLRHFLRIVSTIILFMIPMLTMGIYAEERKRGTMEMLMTSPLTEWQIVFGKFLAAFTLYAIMLAPTLLFQLIMGRYSDPSMPWKVMWSGYLGILLLGAVLIALGSFISALTENQIIAAVVTFVIFLLLWVLEAAARNASATLGAILQYFSILNHFDDFARGVIDTSSIIFYVTLTGLALFLTLRTLDSMRWRRA